MKNKKLLIIIACALIVALTVSIGLYVRNTQLAKETRDAITLETSGKTVTISLDKLNAGAFEGETVNGKGDRSTHSYRGIELQKLLAANQIDATKVTAVTISSADQYTAELTGEELREECRVYVVVMIDGKKVSGIDEGTDGAQIVVFRDQNSKRNVRNLQLIKVTLE